VRKRFSISIMTLGTGKTYIIAEAGVNHNGSIETALSMIEAAAACGADAVKFQTFSPAALASRYAPKAEYQARLTSPAEGQLEMLEKLVLGRDAHKQLIAACAEWRIDFLSTPFDSGSLRLLTHTFGLETIKIGSGDATNAPFLVEVARSAGRVILSTGMCTIGEIENALSALAFGFVGTGDPSDTESLLAAYSSDAGQMALRDRVLLLHCTTEYPAPFGDVNLRAMDAIAHAFDLPVGYSDHTPGIAIPIAAVARGARIVEKHFTLDRTLPGPDHIASVEPAALKEMVLAIRAVELALGDGVKRPTPSEWKNRAVARKSLVAERALNAGDVFAIVAKRPGTGRSPFEYWRTLRQRAERTYAEDEVIDV
jgi:N-acetylneuraminate synthase